MGSIDQKDQKFTLGPSLHLLAYAFCAPDGIFVNLELIRQGYANTYAQYPFTHIDLFRHYERRARESGKGLWGDTTSTKSTSTSSSSSGSTSGSTSAKRTEPGTNRLRD